MSEKQTLYTLLLEYGGGTYIAQIPSHNPGSALMEWVARLLPEELEAWKLTRADLESVTHENPPLALDGVTNVWCVIGSGRGGQILINMVATI